MNKMLYFLNPDENKLYEPQFGRGKKVHLWENGDKTAFDKILIINPNEVKSWNTLLDHITIKLKPSFGGVRKLVCLNTKKSIHSFEEIENDGKYIALGIQKFIDLKPPYLSWSQQDLADARRALIGDFYRKKGEDPEFLTRAHKRRLKVIYVIQNAIVKDPATKFVLTPKDMLDYKGTLRFIARKLDLEVGVEYLCTIFGDVVCELTELQNGCLYVALPFQEKFKYKDYLRKHNEFVQTRKLTKYLVKQEKGIGVKDCTRRMIYCPEYYRYCLKHYS